MTYVKYIQKEDTWCGFAFYNVQITREMQTSFQIVFLPFLLLQQINNFWISRVFSLILILVLLYCSLTLLVEFSPIKRKSFMKARILKC